MPKSTTLHYPSVVLGLSIAIFSQSLLTAELPLEVSPATATPGSTVTLTGQGLEEGAEAVIWGQNVAINNMPLPGYTWDVAQSGSHLYVASGEAGLTVLDISDPQSPALTSNIPIEGDTRVVSTSGNYAYLGTLTGGLYVVDISDPATPHVVGNIATTNSVLDIKVSGTHVYLTTGYPQTQPVSLDQLNTLVFYASLNDRLLGRSGTDIELLKGAGKLTLSDVTSGIVNIPSANFSIENDFGSNGGSVKFPGGVSGGPAIYGSQAEFKPFLNFGDSPAIIALWIDNDTQMERGVMMSGGPHGPLASARGGWSVYEGGIGKVSFSIGRRNHPLYPDCAATSRISSDTPLITDGKKHFIVVVYDTINDEMYIYTDGRKNPVKKLNGCRADTEGDDNSAGPGTGSEWLSIGEAGQGWNGDMFYDGTIQDIYIFKPPVIPGDVDSIILEWFTLGSPGPKAAQDL
jgi:hypothetical protein